MFSKKGVRTINLNSPVQYITTYPIRLDFIFYIGMGDDKSRVTKEDVKIAHA